MALLLLFVGSGASALIYELVWFHWLRTVVGASSVSLAALLVSFMGGMGLGSLVLPVVVSPTRHPLRVYAALELGIAVCGVALLLGLPLVQVGYLAFAGEGAGILLRAAVCTLCLLPPTVLMGATLPTIARWTTTTPEGVSRLGLFYGANIVGAVLGTLLASFYLLRVFDTYVATAVAVAVNVAVAAVALWLARREPNPQPATPESTFGVPASRPFVLAAIGLSGLTALGAEVVWTRQLSLLFGATVYTFSLVLAVFLAGLGLGGIVGAVLARRLRRPGLALGACQLALAIALPFGATMIVSQIPHWHAPDDTWLATATTGRFVFNMLRCAVAMFPATVLWGVSVPFALAAAAADRSEPGRVVGRVTAVNTVGALIGTLVFGLLAVPLLGSDGAQRALVTLAVIAAVVMFWDESRSPGRKETPVEGPRSTRPRPAVASVLAAVLVGTPLIAAAFVPPTPGSLIAYGRQVDSWDSIKRFLFLAEGVNASVAVTEADGGAYQIHISGKVVASNHDFDMRIERMLGHLPALLHRKPRSVLVVGFGAGVTAGSFVVHPDVERIVICEIEPRVLEGGGRYFAEENHHVLSDPRTTVVMDDARHFLATTSETFDIITSDPIHPWVRGPRRCTPPSTTISSHNTSIRAGSSRSGCPCTRPTKPRSRARLPPSSRPSHTRPSGAATISSSATTSCCWGDSSRHASTPSPSICSFATMTRSASRSRTSTWARVRI